jgi:integral membrane sensor domain MASE1
MSHTTYAPSYRPQSSTLGALLREMFAATPLGILLSALGSKR